MNNKFSAKEYDANQPYNEQFTGKQVIEQQEGSWKHPECRRYRSLCNPPPYQKDQLKDGHEIKHPLTMPKDGI